MERRYTRGLTDVAMAACSYCSTGTNSGPHLRIARPVSNVITHPYHAHMHSHRYCAQASGKNDTLAGRLNVRQQPFCPLKVCLKH
eukprot:6183471-Pleurochrysis_carterae.AAC.2